ncbi:MAG: hypothetical protein AB7P02_12385 [Alphaproteobacteria bacterium]
MKLRLALLAALAVPPAASAAQCGDGLGAADVRRVEGRGFTLAYRPEPVELETDTLFSLKVVVCGRDGAAPALVRVDAWMPEHGHGMNYATVLTSDGAGGWRVDGLLFHMPGRWELRFDVGTRQRTERVVAGESVE